MNADNLNGVKKRIAVAMSHRICNMVTGNDVQLLAVTKNHSVDVVMQSVAMGIGHIGENRVQEAVHKREQLGNSADSVKWHLLGHLQTNKVRQAVKIFDMIESVDSVRLLAVLDKEAESYGKIQDILLQLNIAKEPQKTGFSVDEYLAVLPDLNSFRSLHVRGLMVIAPLTENTEAIRSVFRQGYEIYARLLQQQAVDILSMGMTNDFEVAIEEGANEVRIGRALFGERDYSTKF